MSRRQARRDGLTGDCRDQVRQLFAYLDGELTAAACRRIERHLAGCDCCRAFTGSLRRAMAVCRAAGSRTLPQDVRKRAEARARAIVDAQAPTTRRPRK